MCPGAGTDRFACGSALLALERRLHETGEKRVRPVRARLELGVRLRRHVVRVDVLRQLHELDEGALGRGAGEDETRLRDVVAVVVVDLETVTVTLADVRGAIGRGYDRTLRELRGIMPRSSA